MPSADQPGAAWNIDGERFLRANGSQPYAPAGIDYRGPKVMRHTFATWSIEGGVQLSHLATIMGTSVRELEDTYFRWLKRTATNSEPHFDVYDEANGHGHW